MILYLDTETYSATPIKKGTYTYCENAEVMIITYAIDDGPVQCIDMTAHTAGAQLWGSVLAHHLADPNALVVAHNAMFDRNALRLGTFSKAPGCSTVGRQPGITVPIERWRCCMVRALLHGLPGGLDKLSELFKLDAGKTKDGRALIRRFCMPTAFHQTCLDKTNFKTPRLYRMAIEEMKAFWPGRATRHSHPAEWVRFIEYAKQDIEAMRAIWNLLPSWNYGETGVGAVERNLWHADQRLNDRGVAVDRALVHAAIRATDDEQARLKDCVVEHTDGYVGSANQRDRLMEYIFTEYGIGMKDMRGATVDKMLVREDLDPGLQELLRIRAQASQTSTAKYRAFDNGVNSDGRLRGMLQFSGAARTRRDAGRTVQLQNLPSRGLLSADQVEVGIEALLAGCEDLIFDNVMLLTASTIRGCITAPPGRKLVVADLSNIEGRALAWLAGEEWKLHAFTLFDAGKGPDLYKLAYAKAFGILVELVDKFQRSIGKVMELGLGYAGGINAFTTFALVYGIDLEEMADAAWDSLPQELVEKATSFLHWLQDKGSRYPMSDKAAIVCEVFKRAWREAHPMTEKLWAEMELGFRKACITPSKVFSYRGFKFVRNRAWLQILLPSGRRLCYPHPEISEKGELSYMGVNQFTKQWQRIKTYGGRLTENACQSVARDFMFDATPGIEDAGFAPVLRVHDEVVCEAPDEPEYSAEYLSALLTATPAWGAGMPLAAAGFESQRYRKD